MSEPAAKPRPHVEPVATLRPREASPAEIAKVTDLLVALVKRVRAERGTR